jgi:hypothetical protein
VHERNRILVNYLSQAREETQTAVAIVGDFYLGASLAKSLRQITSDVLGENQNDSRAALTKDLAKPEVNVFLASPRSRR